MEKPRLDDLSTAKPSGAARRKPRGRKAGTAKEASVDGWVAEALKGLGLAVRQKETGIPEIDAAIPSKRGTGHGGEVDVFAICKSDEGNIFYIIIEDKNDTDLHAVFTDEAETQLSMEKKAVEGFAVNGAVHYAQHVTERTSYREFIAVGVSADVDAASGQVRRSRITPVHVKDGQCQVLDHIDDFSVFAPGCIEEYFETQVEGLPTREERELKEVRDFIREMHESLRNYGNLEGEKKASVVSAILLALEHKGFKLESLTGQPGRNAAPVQESSSDKDSDECDTDGEKLYRAMKAFLETDRALEKRQPAKLGELYAQFNFIRDDVTLNKPVAQLGGRTPLHQFARDLKAHILARIKSQTEIDILGNFYGEFVKYGGSDGNSLGIVLTPRHVTSLMVELADLKPTSTVLDPCCGTGAFLISAMNFLIKKADGDEAAIKRIKETQLYGIELQQKLFAIASTNMVLRGDGQSNIARNSIFDVDPADYNGRVDAVLINPPYSQAKNSETAHLSELNFLERALRLIKVGGRLVGIVPISAMVGKTKEDRKLKEVILSKHTLEGVLMCNEKTFYPTGTVTCICVFTAGEPHPADHQTFFIDFQDDGYEVRNHIGLVDTGLARDRRTHLARVMRRVVDDGTDFVIRTEVTSTDEWVHQYFYFRDKGVDDDLLNEVVREFISFKFTNTLNGFGSVFKPESRSLPAARTTGAGHD